MAQKLGAFGLYLLTMIFGVMAMASLHVSGVISNTWSNIGCGAVGFIAMGLLQMALDSDL